MQPQTFQTPAHLSNAELETRTSAPRTRTIFRIVAVVVASITLISILVPATRRARAEETVARATGDFRIGWYDYMGGAANLPVIRQEGVDNVMPYSESGADVVGYLNKARESGEQVFLEIDRALVRAGDQAGVRAFVAKYKAHPALAGWYLADEPSINQTLGPLSAATAELLYRAMKVEDAAHPVVIAFSSSDDMSAYRNAYDVAWWDEYPCRRMQLEFTGMDAWRYHMVQRAAAASSKQGFVPVLQAFTLGSAYRLPTANEERYMTYAAIQAGATGVTYWARYRSQLGWIENVLKPITAELRRIAPALGRGEIRGAASVQQGANVVASVFRDPSTGRYALIVVNHGAGRADAKLTLAPSLLATTAQAADGTSTSLVNGILNASLQRYEARVYEIR